MKENQDLTERDKSGLRRLTGRNWGVSISYVFAKADPTGWLDHPSKSGRVQNETVVVSTPK
jgi:hypothetical protein